MMNKTPNTTNAAPGVASENQEPASFYSFGLLLENAYIQYQWLRNIENQALKEIYKAEYNNVMVLYKTAKQTIAKQMEKIERLQNEVQRYRDAENVLLLAEDILLDGLADNPNEILQKIKAGRSEHLLNLSARDVREMLVGDLEKDGIDIAKI